MEPERFLMEPERILMEPERFLMEPNFAHIPEKNAQVPLKINHILFSGIYLTINHLETKHRLHKKKKHVFLPQKKP